MIVGCRNVVVIVMRGNYYFSYFENT